ncbi:hypothetical protein GCM10009753_49200 [Streptantibioticus ferralitis]
MEWIDPRYAPLVEEFRRQEADAPQMRCRRCDGRGTLFLPNAFGGTRVKCPPCDGEGVMSVPFRGFIMA